MDCAFCSNKEVKERIIIENDFAFAFPTNTPIVQGHILICPKRHIQYYEDATEEEKNSIEELRIKIRRALIKTLSAQGFNWAWNEEKIRGHSVPHFHLHVVPRKEGDQGVYQYEPREFLYRPSPRTLITPNDELMKIVRVIQEAIK